MPSDAEDTDDPAPARPNLRGCLPLACLIAGFLTVAGCALYLLFAWSNATHWASVEGVVTRPTVQVYHGTTGRLHANYTSYIPAIEYHYVVNGQDYSGQGIGDGIDSVYDNPADALAAMGPYMRGPL